MMKFSDMEIDEVINVINDSKELRDMLDQYIQETEYDWLDELLRCFDRGAVDYSIGFFDRNYFTVKDSDLFLKGVRKSHDNYGLTVNGKSCSIGARNCRAQISLVTGAKSSPNNTTKTS